MLEVRARLPAAERKRVDVQAGVLSLRMPEGADDDFRRASATISSVLEGIEHLPIIPREAEDILSITSAERHRWLRDGRLKSAGTRTVRLRGRARKITFHVFDPRHIEDVLDRDLVSAWREDDAIAAAENRRRAAGKAALTRARKRRGQARDIGRGEVSNEKPEGWEEFEIDGFLR